MTNGLWPTTRRRERILVFAPGGSGKSHAYTQIAAAMEPGGPRTMYVIETDPTLDAILEHPDLAGVGVREAWRDGEADDGWANYLSDDGVVVVYRVTGWPELRDAMTEVWARAEFEDWIVLDNITNPWEWVQDWYWTEVVGSEQDEFLLQIRKAQLAQDTGSTAKAVESKFNEWSFINPHFSKQFTEPVLNPPCHLYLTAEQTDLVKVFDEKDRVNWAMYSTIGVKPKAQKKSGHLTHTVLWMTKTKTGEHRMTTVKDRGGRAEWQREEWTNFAEDYLSGTGGWQWKQNRTTGSQSATTSSPSKAQSKPAQPKPKPKAP